MSKPEGSAPQTQVAAVRSAGRPRLALEGGLLGLILGILVVAPWATGGGYLILLDWVSGPEKALSPGIFGLSESALDAIPFRLGTQLLRSIVGPQATAWLLIAAFFPIAGAGIANAASGTRWRAYPAVLLFLCNPFVVDRVRAGHVSILLGLALLPWLFAAARDAREQGKWFAVRPALWYALAMSMNPHSAWLGGVVLLSVALLPKPTLQDVSRTILTVLTAGLVYSYALVLWITDARTLRITPADLEAYQTDAGPGGLLATVLSLHGYWRDTEGQVRDVVGPVLGIILLGLVLVAVVAGLARLTRSEPSKAWPLIGLTVTGLALGAGVAGPLGGIYRFAFDTLPLFEAMREQQKWLELSLLGYAIGFGVAAEWVARMVRRRWRSPSAQAAPVMLAGIPLLMAPALIWGLGGSVQTSDYPAGWAAAQREMGSGSGQVLFLPWHGYQSFSFTDGRTVATPGEAYFSRSVLSSDAVELPNLRTDSTSLRMRYLDRVLAAGGNGGFGRLVAPLGVEYLVIANTGEQEEYTWLAGEPDLTLVQRSPSMTTYRVDVFGTGRVVSSRSGDVSEALRLAGEGELGSEAVLEPTPESLATADKRSDQSGGLTKRSATEWHLASGAAGWVVFPQEYSPGWELAGESGQLTASGTAAFEATSDEGLVRFVPWRFLGPAIGFSIMVLFILVVAGVFEHRAQLRALLRGDEIPSSASRGTPTH